MRTRSKSTTVVERKKAAESETQRTDHGAVVTLRGEPLTSSPVMACKFHPFPAGQSPSVPLCGAPSAQSSRASLDDRAEETEANTHANRGYRRVALVHRTVQMPHMRPQSPSQRFRHRTPRRELIPLLLDADDETGDAGRAVKFRRRISVYGPERAQTPPFYDTTYPLRPSLRSSAEPDLPASMAEKQPVVIQRLVYQTAHKRAFSHKR